MKYVKLKWYIPKANYKNFRKQKLQTYVRSTKHFSPKVIVSTCTEFNFSVILHRVQVSLKLYIYYMTYNMIIRPNMIRSWDFTGVDESNIDSKKLWNNVIWKFLSPVKFDKNIIRICKKKLQKLNSRYHKD